MLRRLTGILLKDGRVIVCYIVNRGQIDWTVQWLVLFNEGVHVNQYMSFYLTGILMFD